MHRRQFVGVGVVALLVICSFGAVLVALQVEKTASASPTTTTQAVTDYFSYNCTQLHDAAQYLMAHQSEGSSTFGNGIQQNGITYWWGASNGGEGSAQAQILIYLQLMQLKGCSVP